MLRVGVKFCGGCNPSIDRAKVFREIKEMAGDVSFVGLQEERLSAFLFICGCSTACPVEALGFQGHPNAIVVAGETINGQPVPEAAIAGVVQRLFERENGWSHD